jgi:hypothetical protein
MRSGPRMLRWTNLPVLLGSLIASRSSAYGQVASFVTTLGKDTLAVEQYRRAGDSVVGDWVSTYGGIMFHHYAIRLRPDGSPRHYRLTLHRVSGQVNGMVDIQFAADTAIVTNGSGDEQKVATAGAFPLFAGSVGPIDLLLSRARAFHRDSTAIPTLGAFGPYRGGATTIVFFKADSVRFGSPQRTLFASITADGHVTGLSARATTTRTETRRVPTFDLQAVIAHFPNVPDTVPITGVPAISPRDTVRASIGAASVTIDYGRPAARGRSVFNNGVLGDTIWRAGANAATQFIATRDLIVGSDTLRAGAYSIWVRAPADNSSYRLVFNSQTGQWGTEHHPERDVLSVPLRQEALSVPVERFTIQLQSAPHSTLRLSWAATALTVPVLAK